MIPSLPSPWKTRRGGVLAVLLAVASALPAPALAQAQTKLPNPPIPSAATPPGAEPGYPASLTPAQAGTLKGLKGYLTPAEVPDSYRILPPAPSGTSPAREEDVAAYRETRKLQGGERWRLAASDAILTPFSLLDDESCALGVRLDQADAPRLVALLTRVGRDAGHITTEAKIQFRQPRPFVALGGPICTEGERAETAGSFSYPSGHTTYAWAAGLILAELEPSRATPILARARAYGESRVVCGVHWVSDVEEGRTNGAILVAVLHADPAFEADMAAARREIEAARAGRSQPAGAPAAPVQCAPEAAARTPWTR